MGKRSRKNKMTSAAHTQQRSNTMPRNIVSETLELARLLNKRCSESFGSHTMCNYEDYQTLYELVQQLRIKQSKYVEPDIVREDHTDEFMQWMTMHGTDTSSVEIHQFANQGFGLRAAKDLQVNDLIMEIPRKLMMTTKDAQSSILGPLIRSDQILRNMPNIVMALHLLCERKNPNSFWQPYIKIFPSTYNTPLYFTPEELMLLKGSPAYGEAMNQFRNIARQYAYFFTVFQAYADADRLPIRFFCYDDYRWAVSTVMTRQNQIPDESQGTKIFALIPLWDMCNHDSGQFSTDYSVEHNCGQCFAQHDFTAGDQVTIFYGPRPNCELLIHNGFVYPRNEHDSLRLKLGMSKDDSLYAPKTELLSRLAINSATPFALSVQSPHIDAEIRFFLRVFCMTQDELTTCLQESFNTSSLCEQDGWVSVENECKVWRYLHTRVKLLLRVYATTAETDRERLRAKSLNEHEQLAIQLLLSEKSILVAAADYAAKQLENCSAKSCDKIECSTDANKQAIETIEQQCNAAHDNSSQIHSNGACAELASQIDTVQVNG